MSEEKRRTANVRFTLLADSVLIFFSFCLLFLAVAGKVRKRTAANTAAVTAQLLQTSTSTQSVHANAAEPPTKQATKKRTRRGEEVENEEEEEV